MKLICIGQLKKKNCQKKCFNNKQNQAPAFTGVLEKNINKCLTMDFKYVIIFIVTKKQGGIIMNKNSKKLDKYLENSNYNFWAGGEHGDDTVHYEISHSASKYNVEVVAYEDEYFLLTVHRQRFKKTDDIELATANECYRKTLRGVKNYIEKYIY